MGQVPVKQRLDKAQVRRLQRLVSFSEQEIRDWHKEFRLRINRRSHAHDEFYLTEEEFVEVYSTVYPGKCDEFARHVFRTFDVDGNRRVDFREFLMGLSKSGSSDLHKQLLWAFQLYDVNRTGFITKDNMTQIIRVRFGLSRGERGWGGGWGGVGGEGGGDCFVGCLTSQQQASVSQGRICSDKFFRAATLR